MGSLGHGCAWLAVNMGEHDGIQEGRGNRHDVNQGLSQTGEGRQGFGSPEKLGAGDINPEAGGKRKNNRRWASISNWRTSPRGLAGTVSETRVSGWCVSRGEVGSRL